MAKTKLPKTIFVKWDSDPNDTDSRWLDASINADGFEDGEQVGVYELKQTKQKRVTHELK